MIIRKALVDDKDELIKVIKLSDGREEERIIRKVEKCIGAKTCFFIVAIENEKIVGYLLFEIQDDDKNAEKLIDINNFASVCWIGVLPEFRNRHFGSGLLEEAIKYAKGFRKQGIWLDCREDVLGFYNKNGYKNMGNYEKIDKKGKIKPQYVMVKELI